MKNGKYSKRRGVAARTLVVALVVMLAVGCGVGSTLAWLTVKTDPVVNTFTVGDINIDLTETPNAKSKPDLEENDIWVGKIIPGNDLTKDPKVSVEAGSENCWLFVKIEEENWPKYYDMYESGEAVRKVNYKLADGWKQFFYTTLNEQGGTTSTRVPGMYYRVVEDITENKEFPVLKDNKVTVSGTLIKEEIEEIRKNGEPTLTITAAAIQKDSNIDTLEKAYDNLPAEFTGKAG